MELIHGGDWVSYERTYGRMPLDFSVNTSPLGLPEGVRRAAAEAVGTAERYPDPLCRALREALAAFHGVGEEKIVCGSGASDLIDRICRVLRPKSAALFTPGFAEYERALEEAGTRVTRIALRKEEEFRLTEAALKQIPVDCELLFLCNPNNPTGLLVPPELMKCLLCRCRETGMRLAVDECFLEFADAPEQHSLLNALNDTPELLVIRAFTKTYAMAGLRLGYVLCGDAELADRLSGCGQPWAVSAVAQAAGLAALQEKDYVLRLRNLVSAERQRMRASLASLGLRVIPGEANFLLFQCGTDSLSEKLAEKGILIRDCRNFPGLERGWYRCAVRTGGENDRLVKALREVLCDG